jgi:hypothetical protein
VRVTWFSGSAVYAFTDRARKGWPGKKRNSQRRRANKFEIHFGFLRSIQMIDKYCRTPLLEFLKYF